MGFLWNHFIQKKYINFTTIKVNDFIFNLKCFYNMDFNNTKYCFTFYLTEN